MSEPKGLSIRWTLIMWMFVISAISYLDRVNISIAGKAIAGEYHFTDIQLGYVFSAFVVGYALFQAPGGRLADKFGPRRTLTAAVVWWGVFTTLTAAVPIAWGATLLTMVALRFSLGIGEAVMYPSSNRIVAEWMPSHERGVANGLIFAGVGAGAGVTPPLIVYVMQHYGWRWSFVVSAIIGLLAGLVWYIISRDRPAQHPRISKAELDYIEAGLPEISKKGDGLVSWGRVFTNRDLLAMSISYFAYGYTAYIFFSWFFIYLNTVRGLDLKSSQYIAMLPFMAMAVCSPIGGWISDRMVKSRGQRVGRCGIAVVGMGLAAIFVAAATQVESAQLATVILAGGAGALYLSQSSFWSVTSEIAGPSSGTVSGVMNMGGQIGGAVTASLTPWIATYYGWTASFMTAAALCAVGSVLWFMVDPTRRLLGTDSVSSDATARAAH